LADFSAYYAEADQQHPDGASCQEAEEERRGRVVTVAASAKNVDVGDIEKTLALRIVQHRLVERDAQRPSSMDESALFDIQDPFLLDTHRPLLEEDGGAEVQPTRVSCGNAADSARLAHF